MRNIVLALSVFLMSSVAVAKTSLNPERTIVVSGPITGSIVAPMLDTMDKLVAKDADAPIDLVIASPGGSVVAGYIIVDKIDALRAQGVIFRCVVRSVAASMAFQLLLHCDERYSTPHAFLLWHPVRVFYQGALTADVAKVAAIQMAQTDKMIRHELYEHLPMSKKSIDWHFTNETLHHASLLHKAAPGFFIEVTSKIGNLFNDDKAALDTSRVGGFFLDTSNIQYIHEQFIREENKK